MRTSHLRLCIASPLGNDCEPNSMRRSRQQAPFRHIPCNADAFNLRIPTSNALSRSDDVSAPNAKYLAIAC